MLATLFGMKPAPPAKCRILELGCADGGNLIPMAEAFPDSEFVGIDLGGRQIADGQALVEALGLRNISLRHLDILNVDESFGKFDYIITYGIFSWVPREVQDKILAISREQLAPNGVAYISYNTYPGWRMRQILRDTSLYHTRNISGLRERAQEVRRLLDFMSEATQAMDGRLATTLDMNAYVQMLQREKELLKDRPDVYIAHEFLEEFNDPIYFNEFIAWAGQHGLQYLSEAEFSTMHPSNFPAEIAEKIKGMAHGLIETEQVMDFLRNRTFRQTLLCHGEVRLQRELSAQVMASFWISSDIVPVSEQPDIASAETERFRGKNGTVLTVTNPICKAAMLCLSDIWPRALTFEQLLDAARTRLDPAAPHVVGTAALAQDRQSLGDMLLRCLSLDLVDFHLSPPLFAPEAGEKPRARPLARYQARRTKSVTSLRHEQVVLDDEVSYYLLLNLDGTRDHAALVESLAQLVAGGSLVVRDEGEVLTDPEDVYEYLYEALSRGLTRLARAALLVN